MGIGKLGLGPIIFMLSTACGMQGQNFDEMAENIIDGSITLIYADSLNQLQLDKTDILILDAREKEEFDVSHIKDAVWVGYKDFDISKVEANKNQEIVVYCSVGYRSEKLGEKLEDAGFLHVKNLYGGIFDWKNKGYVVVDNANQETQKIHAYSKSWGKWVINGEKVYE